MWKRQREQEGAQLLHIFMAGREPLALLAAAQYLRDKEN